MSSAKQRSSQHLTDQCGEDLFRSILPKPWLVRNYRPDYGLDLAVEVFEEAALRSGNFATMGEHLWVQLKSSETADISRLKIYPRGNVEKAPEQVVTGGLFDEIDVVRIQIETSELATIERMGIGAPVLLVIADLKRQRCYFVCLNDYIDKILIPQNLDYLKTGHRTVYVPVANDVGAIPVGKTAFRWYSKRAKLIAAFQRFHFQNVELEYINDETELVTTAKYFAQRIATYDLWDTTEMCEIITYYGKKIRNFLSTGDPDLMRVNHDEIDKACEGDAEKRAQILKGLRSSEIRRLWQCLSILPRNLEDVWREWFLPTSLGVAASFRSDNVRSGTETA